MKHNARTVWNLLAAAGIFTAGAGVGALLAYRKQSCAVEQMEARRAHNPEVAGSNPARANSHLPTSTARNNRPKLDILQKSSPPFAHCRTECRRGAVGLPPLAARAIGGRRDPLAQRARRLVNRPRRAGVRLEDRIIAGIWQDRRSEHAIFRVPVAALERVKLEA